MKLLGKQLTKPEQDQVLQESYEPGCVISELANRYGIPSRFIYDLRSKKKKELVATTPKNPTPDFVELSVNTSFKKEVSLKSIRRQLSWPVDDNYLGLFEYLYYIIFLFSIFI